MVNVFCCKGMLILSQIILTAVYFSLMQLQSSGIAQPTPEFASIVFPTHYVGKVIRNTSCILSIRSENENSQGTNIKVQLSPKGKKHYYLSGNGEKGTYFVDCLLPAETRIENYRL